SKVEFTQKLLASKSARAGLVTANSAAIQNNSIRIFMLITLMVADGRSSGVGAEWLTTGPTQKLKRLLNSHQSAILLTDDRPPATVTAHGKTACSNRPFHCLQ